MDSVKEALKTWLEDPNSSYFNFRKKIFRRHGLSPERAPKKILLPSPENAIAVVVTFNPDDAVYQNLEILRHSFSDLLIVDNSPSNQVSEIKTRFPEMKREVILFNGNKNGLAGAINLGIRTARKLKPDGWLFLFDQDTKLKDNYLKHIGNALEKESDRELWNSVYCSDYDDGEIVSNYANPEPGRVDKVPSVITSGSFFRVESLFRIGLYIDEMFIDSLDHEFCLRARRFGFSIKLIRKDLTRHSLGELHVHKLPWLKDVLTHNHPPFRWYFFTRNFIFLCADNFPLSWKWFLRYGWTIFKTYGKTVVFERQKLRKSRAAFLGIFDGICLVFGKNNKRLLSKF